MPTSPQVVVLAPEPFVAGMAVKGALPPPKTNKWFEAWKKIGGGSLMVSLLIHAALLIAGVFVVQTIVHEDVVDFLPGGGSKASEAASQEMTRQIQTKKRNSFQRMPMQRLVSSSDSAAIKLPDIATDAVDVPEMNSLMSGGGMGSGGFGSAGAGGGFGSGVGIGGLKGKISFFGLSSPLERVVFVLDYSASMKPNQLDLVVNEMGKTLKLLPPKAEYQVILFAGGARFASDDWSVDAKHKYDRIIMHRRKKFRFYSPTDSYMDYAFEGKDDELPKERWISANPHNVKRTMENLEQKKTWGGTDWRWGFKMAMNMDPPPKVIFFMTDGLMNKAGEAVDVILDYNKNVRKSNTQFNTLLMHTKAGTEHMAKLAKESSGRFTMVFNDGSSVDGDTYFKDPKKYDAMLK